MMECTQRLECTQPDLSVYTERECPEQIGFLGICGDKFAVKKGPNKIGRDPQICSIVLNLNIGFLGICGDKFAVKKGPNKIGRDPQICSIVLNLNSVSRQHALINVLNNKEYMLMDLDSANKTKLLGVTLRPYVPHPLKNGDMVQFGEVFGIFRLLEDNDDLPMTQALPMTQPMLIPDTPVPTKHVSKLNSVTTIPESPDVSDKDDSFIIASQPKGPHLNTNTHHFIKPGKTISIQPIGSNKIDNIYWNSSKKSTSLNLDDSTSSLNDSIPFIKLNEKENEANANNIHEMNTQALPSRIKENDSIYEANTQLAEYPILASIYTANTQLPGTSYVSPSIYTANTQHPGESPSIHSLDTQLPSNLPNIRKINEQRDMQHDLCTNKDIYNTDTQMLHPICEKRISPSKLNSSNDIVLFDEVDNEAENDNFESQAICIEDVILPVNKLVDVESETLSQIAITKSSKRNMRLQSDSSTDCDEIDDDILPTQNIPAKEVNINMRVNDGDTTDCEDEMIELKTNKKHEHTVEALDLEEAATQVIEVMKPSLVENVDFGDMLTQDIDVVEKIGKKDSTIDFEDLPTQVLVEDDLPPKLHTQSPFEDLPTQVIVEDDLPSKLHTQSPLSDNVEISPFKIPLKSAFQPKKRDASKSLQIRACTNVENKPTVSYEHDKYYQATQDIYEDLCTQKIPEMPSLSKKSCDSRNEEGSVSPSNKSDESLNSTNENINNYVSTLTSQAIREVIGVEAKVAPLKKVTSNGSDASDLEVTPKKIRPCQFMDIDLPNSQEIKTTVSLCTKSVATESSSESETEQNSEDQCTPILFRKKKKLKPNHDAKMDLTKRFDVESLPTRIITRIRKPTFKIQNEDKKMITENILKPKFLTEQDDEIDKDIISENITRLKNKNEKSKNAKDTSKVAKPEKSKCVDSTKNTKDTKKTSDTKNEDTGIAGGKKENTNTIKKDGKSKTDDNIVNLENEPEVTVKEEENRESRRKRKLASPAKHKNVDNVSKDSQEISNESTKIIENLDLSKETDKDKIKTRESKCNISTKVKDEKPRGPIIIEPHTITVPVKEEKKKRDYTRKTKETTDKKVQPESHDAVESTLKGDNVSSKRSVRATRGRKKKSEYFVDFPEDSQTDKRPKRTEKVSKEPSPEKEVRRSKRQKTIKEKEEQAKVKEPVKVKEQTIAKEPVKSILKSTSTHEQSTVYNLSAGSGSPVNLKRPVDMFAEPAPAPKRTRAGISNTSLRATPARMQKTCYVLFTAFPYEEVKSKLEKIGAVVVTDVMQCTVLLTLQIRRTFKLLCAVGLGKPIVGPNWVQACVDTKMIVDPWLYLIKDEAAEKRFSFTLERTIVGKRNFLKGYNVSATPSVMPQASEMKLIVQCSGGVWQEGGARWLCLTCGADRAMWAELSGRGATLVTTELILGGVLHQRLNISTNIINVQ